MIIDRPRNFLVFELLAKVGDDFKHLGLFATEPKAEEEQKKLDRVRFPIEFTIKPRLVEV